MIEKGNIINVSPNYNNTDVDRYTIAAKGNIDGVPSIVGVVVKAYPKNKKSNAKFYLHEVVITEADSPYRTAPQLSVDTVSESASDNSIPDETKNVNREDIVPVKEKILGESQVSTTEPKKNNIRAAWKGFLRSFVSKGAEVETYALKGNNRAVAVECSEKGFNNSIWNCAYCLVTNYTKSISSLNW